MDAVATHDDNRERGAWERARIVGCMSLSPWSKGGVKPKTVLPLPWDGEKRERGVSDCQPLREETKEEAKANLGKLLNRIKKNGNE